MKTRRHFIYVCTGRKVSRTYGGSEYTLQVWEIKGRGPLAWVGACSACTRGHRGEDSEAWGVVAGRYPKLARQLAEASGEAGYWSRVDGERLGIVLTALGGA